jgi:hypothetical protein
MRVTIVTMHSVWCTAEKTHPEEWKGINTHIHVQFARGQLELGDASDESDKPSDYIRYPHAEG